MGGLEKVSGFEDLTEPTVVGMATHDDGSGRGSERVDCHCATVRPALGAGLGPLRVEARGQCAASRSEPRHRRSHQTSGSGCNHQHDVQALERLHSPVWINHLAMKVSRGGEAVYQLAWHLFYSTFRVLRTSGWGPTSRSAWLRDRCWTRVSSFGTFGHEGSNTLQTGACAELRLFGWVNRGRDQPPNLRTAFRATIDAYVEGQMTRWWRASWQDWDALAASDRAVGFPVLATDIRMDAPADDAGESFAPNAGGSNIGVESII